VHSYCAEHEVQNFGMRVPIYKSYTSTKHATEQFEVGSAPAVHKENAVGISCHGADRGVTGPCHLPECAGKRILIERGLCRGCREPDRVAMRDAARQCASSR
jgi:hypothetical protein